MVGEQTEVHEMTVSNMTYSEMVAFYNVQLGRVEMVWFRIMYLHAAMVGVLVFFSEADAFLMLQRAVVFAFFTVNLVIFLAALSEGYAALKAAHDDLLRFPNDDGAVDTWFRSRQFGYRKTVRNLTLVVTWALIGFLLFG
ncbi:MAG: hypothetical protein AAF484_06135 [Pseudomonadota bacterium]